MGISLVKGQKIDIGLRKAVVGLGWDPNDTNSGEDFDLDASAVMVSENRKLLAEKYFVFYNNPASPDGAVASSGDDRTGGNSEGDDESISVNLDRVDPRVCEIVFVVSIYDASDRRQNFGQVRNSFIRIYNPENNEELCKYELGEDFSVETCVEFGRLYKRNGQWRFEATGVGHRGGLEAVLQKYT